MAITTTHTAHHTGTSELAALSASWRRHAALGQEAIQETDAGPVRGQRRWTHPLRRQVGEAFSDAGASDPPTSFYMATSAPPAVPEKS